MQESSSGIPEDAGLMALVLIARFHGIAADAAQMRHAAALKSKIFTESDLVQSAKSIGLKARVVGLQIERLSKVPLPALAFDKSGRHFIIARADEQRILIAEVFDQTPRIT